jgi:hypothetical protein
MIKTNRSYVTLRPGHEDFSFSPDGICIVPRASIEVSQRCPENYQSLIAECIGHGWIKVVANMRDTEYTMELLRK